MSLCLCSQCWVASGKTDSVPNAITSSQHSCTSQSNGERLHALLGFCSKTQHMSSICKIVALEIHSQPTLLILCISAQELKRSLLQIVLGFHVTCNSNRAFSVKKSQTKIKSLICHEAKSPLCWTLAGRTTIPQFIVAPSNTPDGRELGSLLYQFIPGPTIR